MLASQSITQEYLPILYQLLGSPQSITQTWKIITIGLGDLFHQYPQLINQNIQVLFKLLSSNDKEVQRVSISVLSHLILNDYMKVKAEIIEFSLLLTQEDPQIQNLVLGFFREINHKSPDMINNTFPEIV